MKPEIKLAIEVLEAAGYVVALNQEPEKFVPFKGQIVQSKHGHIYKFNHIRRDDGHYVTNNGDDFLSCEPIPGLVQFQPWSELDSNYTKSINILYENGKIFNHGCYENKFIGSGWAPIGFQKLEK